MASTKDPELGKKLDHLEGILGATLPSLYFVQDYQAKRLKTSPAQLSRKRNGTQNISNGELSAFIDLFHLGKHFDYRLFQVDFGLFDESLKGSMVGTYGEPTSLRYRQLLISAADRTKTIAITLRSHWRGGGIGGDLARFEVPVFEPFDRVTLHIPLPGDGHLLVFNDDPRTDEIACLMPSQYAPDTAARGNNLRLPTVAEFPDLPVTGPSSFYRIYAIWSARSLVPHLPADLPLDGQPAVFSGHDLAELANSVVRSGVSQREYCVMFADYRVK